MTGNELLAAAIARLRVAGVPDAPRDARWLLAEALGIAPGRLTLELAEPVPEAAQATFDALIARREAREPVSYILGRRAFYGRDFIVTPDVLDPRPETETVIEQALSEPFDTVLDLGTGSGCILLTLLAERPRVRGRGVDLSPAALEIARANARALGVSPELVLSDWFSAVDGQFDLIVANPPYISDSDMAGLGPDVLNHEPHLALTPGGDGLDPYRIITAQVLHHLKPGGRLIVEIGPSQGDRVQALFSAAGLEDPQVHTDLDNRHRVVTGRAPMV